MKKRAMWIIGSIVAVLFIAVVAICVKILFSPSGESVYGNRLEGIENYPISDEKINEIKTVLLENTYCKEVNYQLTGRIMKFFITVESETGSVSAQRLGDKIIDNLSETELGYYDVSIYISSTGEDEQYPMMGVKSKNDAAITWTVNKGEAEDDEE